MPGVAHPLRTGGGGSLKPVAVAPFDPTQVTSKTNRSSVEFGKPCHTLSKGGHAPGVVYGLDGYPGPGGSQTAKCVTTRVGSSLNPWMETMPIAFHATRDPISGPVSPAPGTSMYVGVHTKARVRRLMPIECERLQGFPDNHTRIPWRGKPAEDCPDSHRYKACGNSMAVPVMRWIGERINQLENRK